MRLRTDALYRPTNFLAIPHSTLAAFALRYSLLRLKPEAEAREANMGELQFAKTFLTTVDSKSTKYQPEHVFDPKTFATRVPYTLPKLSSPPHPPPPRTGPASDPPPGSGTATQPITLTLKSARNPTMTLILTDLPPSTLLSDLKTQVHTHLGGSSVVSFDKIKILSSKKPIPPSRKTIAEVLSDSPPSKDVEFGIMVMGGAPDPPPSAPTTLFAGSQAKAAGPGSEDAAAAEASKAPEPVDDRPTSTPTEGLEKTKSPPVVQPGGIGGKIVLATDGFWTDLEGFLEQRLKDRDGAKELGGIFRRAWESSQAAP